MKNFHFSLNRVLEWQQRKAEQERVELERLSVEKERIRQDREAVLAEASVIHGQATAAQSMPAEDLRHLAAYSASLRNLAAQMHADERQCEQRVEDQRQACIHADRKQRLLESFKARRFEQWKYDFNREIEESAASNYLCTWSRESRP